MGYGRLKHEDGSWDEGRPLAPCGVNEVAISTYEGDAMTAGSSKWLSPTEAAWALRVTPQRIRQLEGVWKIADEHVS